MVDGTPPILEISALQVYFGKSHAIQGANLRLLNGVFAIVGRNGMGKTTLCNAIIGFKRADGGSIKLNGRELVGLDPHLIARAGVGYVPQGRRVWPSLSVDEHLKLVQRSNSGDNCWNLDRIYDVFPRLAERRQNGGGTLSGGEQQMLAIARALLLNPRLLIMDEPTEGLAPAVVDQVTQLIIRLGRDDEMSILLVEQNIAVALAASNDIGIMVNGRIDVVLKSHELEHRPDVQRDLLGIGRLREDPALIGRDAINVGASI